MSTAAEGGGAYGAGMGRLMRTPHARCFMARGNGPRPALTEMRLLVPSEDRSPPSIVEDALVTAVCVGAPLVRENWVDGRPVGAEGLVRTGASTFLDMRRVNQVRIRSPLHSIQFYLPRSTLRLFSGGGSAELEGVRYSAANSDEALHQLALAALPAFQRPDEVSPLFLDHVMMAAAAHLAQAYMSPAQPLARGGLAPWQKRQVLERIEADLGGDITLVDLADQCGLSVRHFTRAFRESLGVSPHRWLMKRRIELAKRLLLDSDLSLAEIAEASCFAHQSHLTRTFTAAVGTSPGAWRRERRS